MDGVLTRVRGEVDSEVVHFRRVRTWVWRRTSFMEEQVASRTLRVFALLEVPFEDLMRLPAVRLERLHQANPLDRVQVSRREL